MAALAEPVRRDLYLFVAAQPEPVSRDQAAEGVGVARHTAKFHLDRLVERACWSPSSAGSPGGRARRRPARPSSTGALPSRVSVSVPERRYDLAGQLMATAIQDSAASGTDVVSALNRAAAGFGPRSASVPAESAGAGPRVAGPLEATCSSLAAWATSRTSTATSSRWATAPSTPSPGSTPTWSAV